jgi:hypothetical protein
MEKTCQTSTSSNFSTTNKQRVNDLIQANHTILNPLPNDPLQTSPPCSPSNHTPPTDNANSKDNIKDQVPKGEVVDDITIEEIKQRIKEIPNKVPGDPVFTQNVKNGSEKLFKILQIIYNGCIKFGHHPKQWKSSSIVMILKPDKPSTKPGSYPPISLLPVLGKLLEKIMTHRLTSYMVRHNHFNPFQYGFRSQKSTVHQLLCLAEQISQLFEQRSPRRTVSIFIDAEKAFDTVWHDGLRC